MTPRSRVSAAVPNPAAIGRPTVASDPTEDEIPTAEAIEDADAGTGDQTNGPTATTVRASESATSGTLSADAAKSSIRVTAKWMLGAYASVGSLFVAGVSFKDLNGIRSAELQRATAFACIALAGVILAIIVVAQVLTTEAIALQLVQHPDGAPRGERWLYRRLNELVANAPTLTLPFNRLDDLVREINDLGREYRRVYLSVDETLLVIGNDPLPPRALNAAQRELLAADLAARSERITEVLGRLMPTFALYAVTRRFRRALVASAIGAALVGIGLIGFAANTVNRGATSAHSTDISNNRAPNLRDVR
jgi:hypothetical protein